MLTQPLKLMVRAAWIAWLVLGLSAFVVAYAGIDAKGLPSWIPRLQRVQVGGAQDNSRAGVALVSFKQVDAFGNRTTLTGGMQQAPIPVFVLVFLVLVFCDINIGGPRVLKHRDH